MTTQNSASPDTTDTPRNTNDTGTTKGAKPDPGSGSRRRLIAWPMALLALTLGLLLISNSVSAWGRRDAQDENRIHDMKEHAEFFVGRMLRKVDASEEQSLRIQGLVANTLDQLAAAHEDGEDHHAALTALLTAETIDREAVEDMRATHLARADEMSRIVSAGLADVMQELTVEQRTRLHERLSRHRGRHRWH